LATSLIVLHIAHATRAQAPTEEQRKQTVRYLQGLLQSDGSYKPSSVSTAGDLNATSSALRAIKYHGGKPNHLDASTKFIRSCLNANHGTFAPTPNGTADVRTTALGLMAVASAESVEAARQVADKSLVYFAGNAKTFEDIRIAAAGIDTVQARTPKADEWIAEINKRRNADGTYGKDASLARETGGSVAAILRLGGTIEKNDAVIKAIRDYQLPDGGWSKDGVSSDLETSYRVLRALYMLKVKPDAAKLRAFVAKCRLEDGSYAVSPGGAGTVSATYFAGILLHWLDDLDK
jgi:hypothetical protein